MQTQIRKSRFILFVPLLAAALVSWADLAYGQTTEVLSLAGRTTQAHAEQIELASDLDGVTTQQNLSVGPAEITFLPDLTAQARVSVRWRLTINNPARGAMVSVVRSSLSGNEKLIKNIRISAQDGLGPVAFVPTSKFLTGINIDEINTAYDQLGSANGTGISRFAITLDLFSPPSDGAGRMTTVISIVAASIM